MRTTERWELVFKLTEVDEPLLVVLESLEPLITTETWLSLLELAGTSWMVVPFSGMLIVVSLTLMVPEDCVEIFELALASTETSESDSLLIGADLLNTVLKEGATSKDKEETVFLG